MLLKAIYRSLLVILLLVLLCWIPRIFFHSTVDGSLRLTELTSWNYLKISFLFDIKTIAIWFLPLWFALLIHQLAFARRKAGFAFPMGLILVFLFLLFSFIAVLYFPITKNIVGRDLFQMVNGQENSVIWAYIRDYWPAAVLVIVHTYLISRLLFSFHFELKGRSKAIFMIVAVALWGLAARGSFSLKPLNHLDAYAALPGDLAVSAMNPVFVLLESINQDGLEEYQDLPIAEIEASMVEDDHQYAALLGGKPNICIIMLESFGLEYTGLYDNAERSYTPFLDSLANHSLWYKRAYANGLRSMDAVGAIYTGVPSLMKQSFVGSLYANIDKLSIPDMVSELGYCTSFYHGADEQSMGFSAYLKAHGLDHYEGLQSYPERTHYDGHWGIYDHFYLQYWGQELSEYRQPWLSGFFSLSSHHPYDVPVNFEKLPEGSLEIHRTIRYSDAALKQFFDEAAQTKWYDSTIFIITADHASINERKQFQTISGKYRVPLLIYAPSYFDAQQIQMPVQHLDILPTLCHLLGYGCTSMGSSLLDGQERSVVHYDGSLHSIVSGQYQLSLNGTQVIGMYNEVEDPEHTIDLAGSMPQLRDSLSHELMLIRQKFAFRLKNNRYQRRY